MGTSTHPATTTAAASDAAQHGDFESFFRASYERLVRAVTPVAGNVDAAEELVQEAMARAYDKWDRVAGMDSPTGYVYATAVNLHRRHHRRRALLRALLERGAERPAHSMEGPESIASRIDLLAAVGRLPAGQRDALLLVEWLGVDSASAAGLLGIESSSVRARIHRARAALHQQLTR